MLCTECGGQMKEVVSPVSETVHGEVITVQDIEHFECASCGEVEYSSKAAKEFSKKLLSKYAEIHGLMSPEEIRALRKRHNLSQSDFEKVLGVKTPTVSRWETGKVLQSKLADNYLRVLYDNPQVMENEVARAETRPGGGCYEFASSYDIASLLDYPMREFEAGSFSEDFSF